VAVFSAVSQFVIEDERHWPFNGGDVLGEGSKIVVAASYFTT
jgi:hypothetical protein